MTLTAELLEDTHLGSGSGGGGIDALVTRDRKGRPVIWASHLVGVLRDAAKRLHGDKVASEVFGRAGGPRHRAVFTSLYSTSHPTSRIWRSTARAAFDNRAPRDETLRVVEHIPQGTRFEGQVELLRKDLPMLRRLLKEVDALGAGRAAGAGRVELRLQESPIPRPTTVRPTERLVLVLRNLEPLCITATSTPDNFIPSLAFVPGRSLLGALAAWLIEAGHRDAATLLVEGRVAVSDALPLPGSPETPTSAEVLPAPLSLLREKPLGASGSVPWWARPPSSPRRVDRVGQQDPGPLRRPEPDLFVGRSDSKSAWTAYRPPRRVRLRNGRPEPNQADPSLFAVDQIVEDTLFLCDVRGESSAMAQLAQALEPVIAGRRWLRVGRGGAPVEVHEFAWTQAPPPSDVSAPVYMILTSDLLVRDKLLRWRTSLDTVHFDEMPNWPKGLTVTPITQDSVAVHGFNGTARLWRMPALAIRRGSVFRVEGPDEALDRLSRRATEGRGLGERTHEGFGRFRLDATLPGVTGEASPSATADAGRPNRPQIADDPSEAVAETTRTWFEKHPRLSGVGSNADSHPSLSQWHDLVSELESGDPNALASRLNPTTAGARNWKDGDAEAVLRELERIQDPDQRARHARMFVRRLRAKMREKKE